ncbi:MAG TPA: RDD family protein [Nocardioidaceae bacterium]|nr:RDD family protein [Nocardioidaceae bacterium]
MSETPPSSAAADPSYPGERLGLPSTGPGAVAGWPRRFAALGLDWIASMLTVAAFIGTDVWTGREAAAQWGPLIVFLFEASILTALLGGSFGQLIVRVVVVRLDGKPVTVLHASLRTLLICLVIPPLVYNRDQRGLHDLAVKTVALRR